MDEKQRHEAEDKSKFLVAMRLGDTPVPIPNTMVKTKAADDTILVTVWESRWLPDQKRITGFTSDQRIQRVEASDD